LSLLAYPLLFQLLSGGSVLPAWKIGVWMERASGRDTALARAWADTLVADFSRRVEGGARLERFVWVDSAALPLAGGDAHHHPDLRDSGLDAAWGVPATDEPTRSTVRQAERAWLSARGCPDERNFAVGWDLFLLPRDPYNKPDSLLWRMDTRNYVRFPSWSELPDSGGLDPLCRKVLRLDPPGHGLRLFSVDTLRTRLEDLLPAQLETGVDDDGGRPASGAVLELWRAVPDPRRPFGARLEGRPDTLRADSAGRFSPPSGRSWFTDGAIVFGTAGSNAVSYWRVRHGRKRVEGWLDATDLARLADSGRAKLVWTLPGGSSRPWREASDKWPHGWLAAQADSSGLLTLGISSPQDADYVLRIVGDKGREFLRTRPMRLAKGVHERILSPSLPEGWWDVRLDSPSERWQVRIHQPPRPGIPGSASP